MLSSARDGLLAFAFPSFCQVCVSPIESWRNGIACDDCWAQSNWPNDLALCLKCGVPIGSSGASRCGRCESLSFAIARACGPYALAWRESVLWLKKYPQVFPRIVDHLKASAFQMATGRAVDLILPVPLHPARERKRGFNQAQVIAEALSRATRLRLDCASLVRVGETTRHRAGMDAAQRANSLKGAFRVRAARGVVNRRVLVVDDVMTTAATANEVASSLLDAGAREVCVLTLARVATAPLWGKRLALTKAD